MRSENIWRTGSSRRRLRTGPLIWRTKDSDAGRRMRVDRKDLLKDEVLSQALHALPARIPPPGLTTSLRVIASRHRQRQSSRSSVTWRDRARLFATNLMRPLALPFAGGVFSTVVLFSTYLIPTYPVRGTGATDVPTALSTEATV